MAAIYPDEREDNMKTSYYDEPKLAPIGGLKSSRLPLSQQEKAIAELHETINQLAINLKPVLTPTNEADGFKEGDDARDVVSPLSDQLNAHNQGIRRATQGLQRLMERIEC